MDSIEIILKEDTNGQEIDLKDMSLSNSKSVRAILDALISLAEYEENLGLRVGLERGSAAHRLIDDSNLGNLEIVYRKIQDVAESRPSRDNFYVKQLQIIQGNCRKFEEAEINYKPNSSDVIDLKPLFNRRFKKRRLKVEEENKFNIVFFKGQLQENGGRKPNFHVTSAEIDYTIQCTHQEARKVNAFLYEDIYVSVWAEKKKDKIEYTFCDIYAGASKEYYSQFQDFFKELQSSRGTTPFHLISSKLEEFYDNKNYFGAIKFIRPFLNIYSSPMYLRTILVMSKAFKEDTEVSRILVEVEKLLSKKIGKVY